MVVDAASTSKICGMPKIPSTNTSIAPVQTSEG